MRAHCMFIFVYLNQMPTIPIWFIVIALILIGILCVITISYITRPKSNTVNIPKTNIIQHTQQIPIEVKKIVEKKTVERREAKETDHEEERKVEQIKVQIDPPEIKRLKKLLSDFVEDETKWDCLIAIGDIYRKGAYPRFLPDEYTALNCFKAAAMCPNGDIAGMGQAKYIETRTEKIDEKDKKGKPLPPEYGEEVCELAQRRIMEMPFSSFTEKPRMKKTTALLPTRNNQAQTQPFADFQAFRPPPRNEYDYLFEADPFDFDQDFEPFDINNLNIVNNHRPQNEHLLDGQNVHDHAVVNTTKRNLDKIVPEDKRDRLDSSDRKIAEIRSMIAKNSNVSDKEVSDALRVIDSLTETQNLSFDITEKEALVSVWNKINEQSDRTLQDNLSETFIKQLASGIEYGHVVCSTGKITRLVSTFDGTDVDNIETSRPLWAVKEEIATLASNVRDEKLKDLSKVEMTAYERGERDDLDEAMRTEFKKKAMDLYCGDLKMSPAIIEPIVKTYEEAF